MKGTIDLGTFAELGVALVGFTALIAVFRGGSVGSWHPRARMALWYIVAHGLGAVLFAMLPSLLAVVQVESWAGALAVLGLFHAVTYGDLLRRHIVLLGEGISTPNLWFYWLNGFVAAANVAVLSLGAFGVLSAPPEETYAFGVASSILIAGFALVGVLRLPEPPAA